MVTGTQRAGTTWVGSILSAGRASGYIHEPFNTTNVNIHNSPIKLPYQYIDESLDRDSDNIFSNYLDYFVNPSFKFFCNSFSPIRNIDSRYILPGRQVLLSGIGKKVKILKDPFALLSSEWLHKVLGWDIVIVVRHPAAFALSMVQKNWSVAPTVFREQSKALKHIYGSHKDLVEEYINFPNKKADLLGCAIYGWRLLHIAIAFYKRNYPQWTIVRHEDLSLRPDEGFEDLCEDLDLKYSKGMAAALKASVSGYTGSGKSRDAKLNMHKWKTALSPLEIDRIKTEAKAEWRIFYEEADW